MESLENNLDLYGLKLIESKSTYLGLSNSINHLGCYIKSLIERKMDEDIVSELIQRFPIFTGREWKEENYLGCEEVEKGNRAAVCLDNDNSKLCGAERSYEYVSTYLENKLKETKQLQVDLVAKTDQEVKERLEAIAKVIEEYIK